LATATGCPQAACGIWIAEKEAGKTVMSFKNREGFFLVGKYGEIYFAAPESCGKLSARVLAGWPSWKLRECS
jgi:hypothetical protein